MVRLVRDRRKTGPWRRRPSGTPEAGTIDPAALAGCEAAINLAGESIAAGRWNEKRKRAIRESRIDATTTIAKALARSSHYPACWSTLRPSATTASRGDEWLDEASSSGSGDFLSSVCRDWEAATEPARAGGFARRDDAFRRHP